MTPTNRHPGTAPRGFRRAFLLQAACGLLAALIAAPARAQGVIEFSVGIGTGTRYRVNGDGTGLHPFAFPAPSCDMIIASTRTDYPGGRQYLYVNGTPSGALMAWSEGTGQSKVVASFPSGPAVYSGGFRWSNDGLDRFVSFTMVNGNTGWTYRAHVSAADIASPSYPPISSLLDPRLELVCHFALIHNWWNQDGSRLFYIDPSLGNLIRAKSVGFVSNTPADDPVVFTGTGQLGQLRVIPPVDPLNPDRYLVAGSGNGILAIDLATSTWWLPVPLAGSGFSAIGRPVFSPDGQSIAFGATRLNSKKIPYSAVYRVPFFVPGGPITRVSTEFTTSKSNTSLSINPYNWNLP